ncbi:efflux RND transporter permease subunit [Agarivorans sp. TSD2052]|uniref:efflux RND transporter permease subunit n=1 Tax=Agarivorans sp. TSD2052 TaxID=2937286 RepID=UPI00200F9825|nr:efflux RND transporter permease subunit [Agarivorans sp. TSD2052]UPW20668.1 efflux RND transporter permease subunit [Agarivorans sp. TSD2052]
MIAWFTRNHVAANLLMVLIVGLGLYSAKFRLPLEVFPEFELDMVNVSIALPGSSPEESEESLAIRIEEAISDIEGVEQISSVSQEGAARVSAEINSRYDTRDVMSDIKSRIDAINTFPSDAERPVVSLSQRKRETITVAISGELKHKELRLVAESIRDELLQLPELTQVELDSVAPYEISIEVSEQKLREYGLELSKVAETIRQASLDLSAGSVKTQGGEILLRTKGQAYIGGDFDDLVIISRADGTRIKLSDIATVVDGFEETPIVNRFNNQPAVMIEVYRVGDQSAIAISEAVKQYIVDKQAFLPQGLSLNYWRDSAKIVKARLNTLKNSAIQGCILVALLLAIFLRPAIAVWVCIGIPISFMGGLLLMPTLDVTINIISLFAFIMVLGILVDDAIVTGENIYTHLKAGEEPLHAAIKGTQEVAVPVTFGVLTTVAAFLPLMMIDGVRGKIFAQIPLIVIPVLLFSLVESKLILPAHLKHIKPVDPNKQGRFSYWQNKIADGFENAILRFYRPLLKRVLSRRLLSASVAISIFIIILSLATSGWVRFIFFPRVPSETARASLVMPAGTAFNTTDNYINRMLDAALILQDKYRDPDGGDSIILNILATSGSSGGSGSGQSNVGRVIFEIEPPESRTDNVTSSQLVKEWRQLIGGLPGAESLTFRAEIGRGGSPLDVQLSSNDFAAMAQVASLTKQKLAEYPAVFDVEDSLANGKLELQLNIKPQAQALGLSLNDLAQQVRSAFFGYQVQRIQRGKEDVKVYVRYPASERRSQYNLNTMLIRTPTGAELPFSEVATITPSQSPATITRIDRLRTQNIRADVNKAQANIEVIKSELQQWLSDTLVAYPQVNASLEGEAKEQRDSFSSLGLGLIFVLFVIYGLLAIPFGSYWQPLVVMSIIPYGAVGAVVGHMIMGMPLTIMSMMGMLALTGVVVNDSLVLVDYINRQRAKGVELLTAVTNAGVARFRAVILTSLTTFAGLMPLIFEKSTQAQFLIPMAVSLGFGILFATMITLLIVPVNYLLLEDAKRGLHGLKAWWRQGFEKSAS